MPSAQMNDAYQRAIEKLPQALEQAYTTLVQQGPIPLEGTEITKAMLLRLRAFYLSQKDIKEFLGKRVAGAAADFFVETVLFYLKALNETHRLGFEIASERAIERKRNAIRPDISVWNHDELVASIECKTQLGWNRDQWQRAFESREKELKAKHPRARMFLLVLTTENWSGFGDNPKVGKQFFVLSKMWPSSINPDKIEEVIGTPCTPIEKLFKQITKTA